MNFSVPTPVQAQAIPPALKGKDVIASAQTGTGKTAAFGIPLLTYLDAHQDRTALVLTPTRELAMQVLGVLNELSGKHSTGGSVLLIGGANMGGQHSGLSRKPRLIIGTPGRIIDHLNQGTLDLSRTGFLVLDEADRMLDMGFAPQLDRIRDRLPKERQTLLFSATMPPDIQSMGANYLREPIRITVGATTQPVPKVKQVIVHMDEGHKAEELAFQLRERRGSILVFARTQHRVDRILDRLKKDAFKATKIHGGRSQSQRKQAIEQFRDGKVDILVATDIAARGLDIHHIAHVINYDLPRNPEDYIHRVGRTARAGAEGSALCLLTPTDRDLWSKILKLMGLPKESIEVKPSHLGDFSSRFTAAPMSSQPRPQQHRPPQHQGGHRPQHDPSRPSGRPQRPPHGNRDRHPHPHQDRPRGQQDRHPSSSSPSRDSRGQDRHGQRPGGHQRHDGNRRDSQGNNFIFHGKGYRQTNEGGHEEPIHEQDSFLSRLGNKFFKKDQPGGHQGHPGNSRNDQRPFRDQGHRPGGQGRPNRFEDRSGGFNRHSSGEHRHRDGQRRQDPQGQGQHRQDHPGQGRPQQDQRPGGNFKKRRFPPRNH
jgi:ATP-dependent RNA helicase DeaD